jgi:hypothetical protein
VNVPTSAPSRIPVVDGVDNASTVHSTNVAFAFCFEAEERIGVSSGARIVKTSVKSSLLETPDPGDVISYVLLNAIMFYWVVVLFNDF